MVMGAKFLGWRETKDAMEICLTVIRAGLGAKNGTDGEDDVGNAMKNCLTTIWRCF
jgi:N-methylhydantoinase B/oxoprolinase/acetone carboxylase alpha subunit